MTESLSPRLTQAQMVYLDALRALAALAVLFCHAAMILDQYIWMVDFHLGSIGVLVFFLLSGFLISHSVFLKGGNSGATFTSYMIDRFCRIFVVYVPVLFLVWLTDRLIVQSLIATGPVVPTSIQEWVGQLDQRTTVATFISNLFMLQDYPAFQVLSKINLLPEGWYIRPLGSAGPLWTVAIEWWFYIAFGLMAYAVIYRQKVPLWGWGLGLISLPVVGYNLIAGYDNCLTLVWLMGLIMALVHLSQASLARVVNWLGRFGLPLLALVFLNLCVLRMIAVKIDTGSFAVGELQFAFYLAGFIFTTLLWLARFQTVPRWLSALSTFFAGYSYSLYLVHSTVLLFLQQYYRDFHHDPRLFWGGIVVSNLVAIVCWLCFEQHYRRAARWLKARYAAA